MTAEIVWGGWWAVAFVAVVSVVGAAVWLRWGKW